MYFYRSVCTNCGKEKIKDDQYWGLGNYFGITGTFCGECYDKVSHDSYGNPNHPGEYIAILLKQQKGTE